MGCIFGVTPPNCGIFGIPTPKRAPSLGIPFFYLGSKVLEALGIVAALH